ncbi:MAG: hypothetical protein P8179_16390 [Candidatus Thiodiazotropha sp.]|jgi:hypothetical protein
MKKIEYVSYNVRTSMYYLLCIFTIIAMQSRCCFAAIDVDIQGMYQYANSHLYEFLDDIPEGDEIHYGFNSRDEFKNAELGMPYQEYDMDKEQSTGYWRVPVTVGGDNRVLLRLMRDKADGWTFMGLSGNQLAINLGDLENYVTSQGLPPTAGRIIRDYSMRCDYVQFDPQEAGELSGYIYPLWSASRFIATSKPISMTVSENYQSIDLNIIKDLRMTAKNRMEYINLIDNLNRGQ